MDFLTVSEGKNDEKQWKQLGVVWSAALLFLAIMSKLWAYLKRHSGSFRPLVVAVEITVGAFVPPLNELLYYILLFADELVDKATVEISKHGPNFLKKIISIVHWCCEITEEICDKARKEGILAVAIFVGVKFALFVMTQSVKLLVKLGHFPAMPTLPGISLPSTVTAVVENTIGIGTELVESVTDIAEEALGFGSDDK